MESSKISKKNIFNIFKNVNNLMESFKKNIEEGDYLQENINNVVQSENNTVSQHSSLAAHNQLQILPDRWSTSHDWGRQLIIVNDGHNRDTY